MIKSTSVNSIETLNKRKAYDRYLHIMFVVILVCSIVFCNCYNYYSLKPFNHYRNGANKMLFNQIKDYAISKIKGSKKHSLSKDDMSYIKANQHIIKDGKEETPCIDTLKIGKVSYNVKLLKRKSGMMQVLHPVYTNETIQVDDKSYSIPRFIDNAETWIYDHTEAGRDKLITDLADMAKANDVIHDSNRQKLSDAKNDIRSGDTREVSESTAIKRNLEKVSVDDKGVDVVVNAIKTLIALNLNADQIKKLMPNVDVHSLIKEYKLMESIQVETKA